MLEMRLFEVGLKEKASNLSYTEKVNVAAEDADAAIAKARQWVIDKTNAWWEDGGREDMTFDAYAEDKKAPEEMGDDAVLASEKYQKLAQKVYDDEIERVTNMLLAKVLDIGTLIV